MLGPLSAPRPTPACPDLRSSDQRRAEALVQICRRAAAAGGAAPATTKAAIFVTVDLEDLRTRSGAGTTMTGQALARETIRAMACDAMIIPVVLGTDSEVLDVGRARRLFTPGMLRAMWLRDKGCTIPGCTAPRPGQTATTSSTWVDGGHTSLVNGALLCGRHPPPRFAGGTPSRPPAGLDRDRHHQRSHLAHMTTQPHSPPGPAGTQACPGLSALLTIAR